MPELPEVETVLGGLSPQLSGKHVKHVVIRHPKLRWPIPADLKKQLEGQSLISITRRGKYLLFQFQKGHLIIHLGMSGTLRLFKEDIPPEKHDHLDILFSHDLLMRYRDPRRFGAVLWTEQAVLEHPLLKPLGVEPLSENFTGSYLLQKACNRRTSIKNLIMDSHVVTGIGNIYAAESLFLAGIHPAKPAGHLNVTDYERLVEKIREVLCLAIAAGGTTLKDFMNSAGKPGYFTQKLYVYGREEQPCLTCHAPLKSLKMAQRSTVFCEHCQI